MSTTRPIICALVACMLIKISVAYPKLGAYTGPAPNGVYSLANYSKWLNNPVVYGLGFEADDDWQHISGTSQNWLLVPWSRWVNSAAERQLILSIPMLPKTTGVSIQEGATGTYNQTFLTLAHNLMIYNLSSTLLRIGWEFNGGWYAWTAKAGCNYWSQYFKNIVDTMRSIQGNNFKVIWNVANGYVDVDDVIPCYPGDGYVDYIGIDAYDVDWSTYKWSDLGVNVAYGSWSSTRYYKAGNGLEHNRSVWKALVNNTNVEPGTNSDTWKLLANSTQLQTLRVQAWNVLYNGHHGIKYWTDFAKNHSKPVIMNEWGVWAQTHGGFDNDYFIEQMYNYLIDDTNNVQIQSYFDVFAGDGDHQLRPVSQFPHASQKFWELFSVPVDTPNGESAPQSQSNSPVDTPVDPNGEPTPQSQVNSPVTSEATDLAKNILVTIVGTIALAY